MLWQNRQFKSYQDFIAEFNLEELCNLLIKLPRPGSVESFTLANREAFRFLYNTHFKNIVISAGRQVGKSTFLGNRMLIRSAVIPNLFSLYVSPTYMQTSRFSYDKLATPLHFSEELRLLKGGTVHDSILSKKFINGSEIILRAAFRTAARLRGITAHELYIDEFQDFLPDLLPVIEECIHTAPPELRARIYTGTFKSQENILTTYHYNHSARMEWAIPCTAHSPVHWNIIGINNIGPKGLVCDKCGKLINAQEGKWVLAEGDPSKTLFISFRLPQPLFPLDWEEFLWKQKRYTPGQFFNDCLALPYDVAERAVTLEELKAVCLPDVGTNKKLNLNFWREYCVRHGAYAGVDWGFGTTSFTVLAIGTYYDDRFIYFFLKRYEGIESEPEFMTNDILRICNLYNVRLVGLDFGYGFGLNDRIRRNFRADRTYLFEYVARKQRKAVWSKSMERFLLDRTEVLADFFDAIKRKSLIGFPNEEEFMNPFGKNFLAVFKEENKSTKRLTFSHSESQPDDAVHACLYAFLVSCIEHPRPSFFSPVYED